MVNVGCHNCGYTHLSGPCPKRSEEPVTIPPRLQPADPWDNRQGIQHVADFEVDCSFTPINEDWALIRPVIRLPDGVYVLAKDVEVYRIRRHSRVSDKQIETPELSCIAWTKKVLGNGGVSVLGLHERNPGHMTESDAKLYRWYASVGSRLSVALVKLDGNLAGMARLVPVE